MTRPQIAALVLVPTLLAFTSMAQAYDPCHRAIQERDAARDDLNRYYANNCTWSYEPSHCRNSGRGYELEHRYQALAARARDLCRG